MTGRYEAVAGAGLLARRGDAVLWATPDVSESTWSTLVELAGQHPGTDPSGGDTAERIRDLLEELERSGQSGFGALLVEGGQGQAVLRGPAVLRNATGPAPASGYGSVGITVPFPLTEAVFLGFAGSVAQPGNPLLALVDGVVAADGVWVHPSPDASAAYAVVPDQSTADPTPYAPEPVGPPEPAAAAAGAGNLPSFVRNAFAGGATAASAAGAATALAGAGFAVPAPDLGPDVTPIPPKPDVAVPSFEAPAPDPNAEFGLPLAPAGPAASDAAPPADGFVPAADHLRIDLIDARPSNALPPLPPIPSAAPAAAPPRPKGAGVLVFDDGSTFALDQDYVIGRKPERHALVQSGQARPLTVVDPDTVLSGAHAALRLQNGQVFLEDLGSLNGSHIAAPGATEWTRIQPHQPLSLEPGTRLLFGWTVATYSGSAR